ncbi:ribonuclease P protein component [Selenomonas sp. TAMA-11512]|nr:ribonuclease P protein component [Selenomonas sp. TAMA-11512]
MIKRRADFQRVYQKGKTFSNRMIVIYVFRSDDLFGRVGFAAGKKLGSAPVRNRVKRLLRESYRLHREDIKDGYAILLVGRKAATAAKCQDVERALVDVLRRAKLLKKQV